MNQGYPPYPGQPMPGQQSGTPYPVYPPQNTQSQPGFGSSYQPGYPPAPGCGYPPAQQSSGYPPQPMSAYPSTMPGPQSSYPSMPSSHTTPAPGMPFPQTTSSFPAQPGYPSQSQSGYPSQSQPGYPPQSQPGYPPQSQPGYPSQSQLGYPSSQPGYPQSQPYPNHAPNTSYPSQAYAQQTQQCTITSAHYNTLSSPIPPTQNSPSHFGKNNAYSQYERPTPTVLPISPFDPRSDAEILRKAMKGFGTDEKAIISVLTKRSNSQRLEIANTFKGLYGKDLISDLKSELSGKFEDLIIALVTPLPEYLAKEVQHAIEGVGTNEETLVEILCTATNAQIYAIKDAYQRLYLRSLENELASDTSGHFKRLLISLVQGRRSENAMVDEAAVAKDARDLMAAGVLQVGTDESTFNAILCTRSYAHLRRVMTEYQRISGHTLEKAVRNEFSGDIKSGLLAILLAVEDKPGFFAERLRDSIACVGTKDRQLIRIVVSRCEIDMQEIKRAYQLRYQKSLEQAISEDTSGDYKKALLSLIGSY